MGKSPSSSRAPHPSVRSGGAVLPHHAALDHSGEDQPHPSFVDGLAALPLNGAGQRDSSRLDEVQRVVDLDLQRVDAPSFASVRGTREE